MLANVHVWPLLSIMLYIIGIIVLLFFSKDERPPGKGKTNSAAVTLYSTSLCAFFVDDNIMMGSLQ